MMMNFDAAGREACVVRELRTNTPLQALNLMNDVTYLEAARKMAERMMREGGDTPASRIGYGFKLATARPPSDRETEILLSSFGYYRDGFATDPGLRRQVPEPGPGAPRRKARRARAGCVRGRRQHDPQSRCGGDQGMKMDRDLLTRRYFFGKAGAGLGAAALSSLLQAGETPG